jgi:hypothetical protein
MTYSKKDRTKIIVLAVVLGTLWVFIGVRYLRLSQQWEQKVAEEHRKHEAAVAALQASQEPVSAAARLAAMVQPVAPPERDPFHPVIAPRTRGAAPAVEERPAEEVPPLPVLSNADASGRYDRTALHVTGIILGQPSTAVLRVGERHFVIREGDVLDGDLRVVSIGATTVTLRGRRNTYALRLGQ